MHIKQLILSLSPLSLSQSTAIPDAHPVAAAEAGTTVIVAGPGGAVVAGGTAAPAAAAAAAGGAGAVLTGSELDAAVASITEQAMRAMKQAYGVHGGGPAGNLNSSRLTIRIRLIAEFCCLFFAYLINPIQGNLESLLVERCGLRRRSALWIGLVR